MNAATVTLRSEGGRVIAEIREEGCGFNLLVADAAPVDRHVGLAGMRERAAVVGGP